ncbi:hypothetical protein SDJN02_11162, partial [Cucurbita argyrosperma subsp. argyrosperma]
MVGMGQSFLKQWGYDVLFNDSSISRRVGGSSSRSKEGSSKEEKRSSPSFILSFRNPSLLSPNRRQLVTRNPRRRNRSHGAEFRVKLGGSST